MSYFQYRRTKKERHKIYSADKWTLGYIICTTYDPVTGVPCHYDLSYQLKQFLCRVNAWVVPTNRWRSSAPPLHECYHYHQMTIMEEEGLLRGDSWAVCVSFPANENVCCAGQFYQSSAVQRIVCGNMYFLHMEQSNDIIHNIRVIRLCSLEWPTPLVPPPRVSSVNALIW